MKKQLVPVGRPRVRKTRPLIMGIVNATPDSFSDGGRFLKVDDAVARGVELRAHGADIIDVGGESTRPGAARVPEGEEQERVLPVIEGLAARGIRVSVDTMNASTALAAAEAGADIINDVSGGLADPGMYRVVAQTGLHYVAMHWRGHSDAMADLAEYDDVVSDVRTALKARIAELIVWGVRPDRVILDPGIGFAKTAEHNWTLLGHLDELTTLGYPLLIGVSRKKFLGELLGESAPLEQRDLPTAVTSVLAAQAGAWAVRVHDVASTRVALDVLGAWQTGASA